MSSVSRERTPLPRQVIERLPRLSLITSTGPRNASIDLIGALTSRAIGGAALDVFDVEPLPANHAFRSLDNVLVTPHIGYVAENLYRTFYGDVAVSVGAWLDEIADRSQP